MIIYAFSMTGCKGIKIGQTKRTAKERINEIISILPYTTSYEILLEKEVDSNITDTRIHKYLKGKGFERIGNEWFNCSVEDIEEAIKTIEYEYLLEEFKSLLDYVRTNENCLLKIHNLLKDLKELLTCPHITPLKEEIKEDNSSNTQDTENCSLKGSSNYTYIVNKLIVDLGENKEKTYSKTEFRKLIESSLKGKVKGLRNIVGNMLNLVNFEETKNIIKEELQEKGYALISKKGLTSYDGFTIKRLDLLLV